MRIEHSSHLFIDKTLDVIIVQHLGLFNVSNYVYIFIYMYIYTAIFCTITLLIVLRLSLQIFCKLFQERLHNTAVWACFLGL